MAEDYITVVNSQSFKLDKNILGEIGEKYEIKISAPSLFYAQKILFTKEQANKDFEEFINEIEKYFKIEIQPPDKLFKLRGLNLSQILNNESCVAIKLEDLLISDDNEDNNFYVRCIYIYGGPLEEREYKLKLKKNLFCKKGEEKDITLRALEQIVKLRIWECDNDRAFPIEEKTINIHYEIKYKNEM